MPKHANTKKSASLCCGLIKVVIYLIIAAVTVLGFLCYNNYSKYQVPAWKFDAAFNSNEAKMLHQKYKYSQTCNTANPESDDPCTRLSKCLQFNTVSHTNPEEFAALKQFLIEKFPLVHSNLKREEFELGLLYTWEGRDKALDPILLMSHYDVVPAPAANWTYPPFSGKIADGFIWGRGALDIKSGMMAILEATETLLSQGYKPLRGVYLAFGQDEEVGGEGAKHIVKTLKERGVTLEVVVDEGGFLSKDMVAGISQQIGIIGFAEKGAVSLKLEATVAGGHSSTPSRTTAIGTLANAITRLEANQVPSHINGIGFGTIFRYLGPRFEPVKRIIFSNLWLFAPVIELVASKTPTINALIRTTTAPTIFNAGVAENVLPGTASAVVNFRLAPGDSIESLVEHVKSTIQSDKITVTVLPGGSPASSVSCIECKPFEYIVNTAKQVHNDDVIYTPYIVVAMTDSRHYRSIAKNVYNYLPHKIDPTLLKTIHAIDERIGVQNYLDTVEYFYRLVLNSEFL